MSAPEQWWLDDLRATLGRSWIRWPEAVFFGSVVLKLHGLRQVIGDIDLFVSPMLYADLRTLGWEEQRPHPTDPPLLERRTPLPVHAFYAWTPRDPEVDAGECFRRREDVLGFPCAPLDVIAKHKRQCLDRVRSWGVEVAGSKWEKHEADLALIERALAA